jgi:hypothetical protein
VRIGVPLAANASRRCDEDHEADWPDPRVLARLLEALADLGAIEGVPGLRMGEDELVVAAEAVRFDQRSSSSARSAAIGTERLVDSSDFPRGVLSAHVPLAHPDTLRSPVDIAPAQAAIRTCSPCSA